MQFLKPRVELCLSISQLVEHLCMLCTPLLQLCRVRCAGLKRAVNKTVWMKTNYVYQCALFLVLHGRTCLTGSLKSRLEMRTRVCSLSLICSACDTQPLTIIRLLQHYLHSGWVELHRITHIV